MAKYLRVSRSFSTDIDGVPTGYAEGQVVQSNDPGVTKSRTAAGYFEDIEDHAARTTGAVETATAAPGQRRSRSSVVKKTQKRTQKRLPAENQTGDEAKPDTSTPRNPAPDEVSTTTGKATT